jgi:hypothetical protein
MGRGCCQPSALGSQRESPCTLREIPSPLVANVEESGSGNKTAGGGEAARCFAYLPHRSLPELMCLQAGFPLPSRKG